MNARSQPKTARVPQPRPQPRPRVAPSRLSRLQREILARGGTQERMAIDLHLDPSYVSLVCSGKRVPSIETSKRMADWLGVSLDRWWEILRGTQKRKGKR